MKKGQGKIKQLFQKLYWLPAVLLVAIVFILVFSLQGVKGVGEKFKDWFHSDRKCKACERVEVDEIENIVTGKAVENGEEVVFVYYFDKSITETSRVNLDNTYKSNKALNEEIKAYNKDNDKEVVVYAINYALDLDDDYVAFDADDENQFEDDEMTTATYLKISELVFNFLHEQDPECYPTFQDTPLGTTPILVRYEKQDNNTYEVTNAITHLDDFNAKTIRDFFDGNYDWHE